MSRRLINISKRHLEKNYIIYFILSLLIIVGIIIGSIFILKVNEVKDTSFTYKFNYIFKFIKSENYTSKNIFNSSLIFNMKFLLFIWVLGFVGFGIIITPLIIGIKGFSIGLTVGYFVKEFGFKGFIFSILGFLPNYLLLIPIFLIIATVSILKSISYTNLKGNKLGNIDILDYGIILFSAFAVVTITVLLEGYFISTLFGLMSL